jgi:hypothetical protein
MVPLLETLSPTPFLIDFPDHTMQAILRDSSSPQAQAYQCLLNDPNSYPEWRLEQRFALATIYYATSGDEWSVNENWLDYNIHECLWAHKAAWDTLHLLDEKGQYELLLRSFVIAYYVHNGNIQYPDAMYSDETDLDEERINKTCSQDGEFQHLWLYDNVLVGTLPPEIGMLSLLETIDISDSLGLLGAFPTQLGQLTRMKYFSSEYNSISGTLPTELGLLTSMRDFDVDSQFLTGTIPTELGLWRNVIYISLVDCSLTTPLPSELGQLSTLRILTVGRGYTITGPLPSELGLLSDNLWLLFVHETNQGSIPTEFGMLSALLSLHLEDNSFAGSSIPTELGLISDSSLEFLYLPNNHLEGPIPTQLGHLQSLLDVNLPGNNIAGPIPSELSYLSRLQRLDLSHNKNLASTIPSELALLGNLSILSLDHTSIQGTLPNEVEIGWATNLKGLSVQGTFSTGTLLPEFCNLSSFLYFTCSDTFCGCDCPC